MEIEEGAKTALVGLFIVAPTMALLWFKPLILLIMISFAAMAVICFLIGDAVRTTWGF